MLLCVVLNFSFSQSNYQSVLVIFKNEIKIHLSHELNVNIFVRREPWERPPTCYSYLFALFASRGAISHASTSFIGKAESYVQTLPFYVQDYCILASRYRWYTFELSFDSRSWASRCDPANAICIYIKYIYM